MARVEQETPKDLTAPPKAKGITSTKKFKDEQERDKQPVRGIFRFHEVPGGTMMFPYKKYKGEPVQKFTLKDGEVYSIPLGVAKHLNKNCWYPVHDYQVDDFGKFTNQYRVNKKVRRCSFQSLEFVETDDLTPVGQGDILTVERIGSS